MFVRCCSTIPTLAILLADQNTYMTGETVIVGGGYVFA